MASSPDVTGRDDTTLWAADAMLLDILDRASDWQERPEGERADFYLEWEAVSGRIEDLQMDYRDGRLTSEQRRRFETLRERLAANRDVIMSLGLVYPVLDRMTRAS